MQYLEGLSNGACPIAFIQVEQQWGKHHWTINALLWYKKYQKPCRY
jgi:hypothetical protein